MANEIMERMKIVPKFLGEVIAYEFETGDLDDEWLSNCFFFLPDGKIRVMMIYEVAGAFNACALSGRKENGQSCQVYYTDEYNNRVNLKSIFVGDSYIRYPKKESWMYEQIPLLDVSQEISKDELKNKKFKIQPYSGWWGDSGDIECQVPQFVYDYINS